MYYIIIHWDGKAVDGFIHPGGCTKEEAVTDVKKRLIGSLHFLKKEMDSDPDRERHEQIYHFKITKIKAQLRSFKRPWREGVLKVTEIKFPLRAGYWLEEVITKKHACNILPFEAVGSKEHHTKP